MPLTLRLNETEEKKLEEIKKILSMKTSSGCIKLMINNHKTDNQMFQLYIKENKELRSKLALIKETIMERQKAKNQVNKLQSKLSYLANK